MKYSSLPAPVTYWLYSCVEGLKNILGMKTASLLIISSPIYMAMAPEMCYNELIFSERQERI